MHWVTCGLIIFGFSAPTAVVGVPYAFGTQGLAVAAFLCILFTGRTLVGAILALELACRYEEINEYKDLGKVMGGLYGVATGSFIQNGNFLLYLPVALVIVSSTLQASVDPNTNSCVDYYIIGISIACLVMTQVRTLNNAESLSVVSLVCVLLSTILIVYIPYSYENSSSSNVLVFGNPTSPGSAEGIFQALLGVTTAMWAYVPTLLVVELRQYLPEKGDMLNAIYLSAVLTVVLYIIVGATVVLNWGWDMNDPLTIVAAWPSSEPIARTCSALLFVANIIAYTIDAVAITAKVSNYLFSDVDLEEWSATSFSKYFLASLLPWFFAVIVALFAPNLFVVLAFVTALTVPWVNMVFPAYCFLADERRLEVLNLSNGPSLAGLLNDDCVSSRDGSSYIAAHESKPPSMSQRLTRRGASDMSHSLLTGDESTALGSAARSRTLAVIAIAVGIIGFMICMTAAIGKVVFPNLRGPSVVGCPGWYILNSN